MRRGTIQNYQSYSIRPFCWQFVQLLFHFLPRDNSAPPLVFMDVDRQLSTCCLAVKDTVRDRDELIKLCEQLRIVEDILDLPLGIGRSFIKPHHRELNNSLSGYCD